MRSEEVIANDSLQLTRREVVNRAVSQESMLLAIHQDPRFALGRMRKTTLRHDTILPRDVDLKAAARLQPRDAAGGPSGWKRRKQLD